MLTKQEIRALPLKELLQEVLKSEHELLREKFAVKGGHSKASHVVKNLRIYIAQLQTIAKEKQAHPTVK